MFIYDLVCSWHHTILSSHVIPTHADWILWNVDFLDGFTEKPTEKRSVSVSVFFRFRFQNRPKPTDVLVKNGKTDRAIFHFRFTTLLKAQQNQEGDTDTVTVYLFLAKITCTSYIIIFKMPDNGIPLISRQITVHQPVYGTFNDNKTKRGIPICRLMSRYTALLQKIRRGFSFCLGFRVRMFFVVVAKNPKCINQVKI